MKKIKIIETCEPFFYNTYNDLNVFEIGDIVELKFGNKSPQFAGKTKKFVVNNFMKHNWRRPTRRLALVPLKLADTFDRKKHKDDILILDDGDRFECLMIDLFPINQVPYKNWKNKTIKIKKVK